MTPLNPLLFAILNKHVNCMPAIYNGVIDFDKTDINVNTFLLLALNFKHKHGRTI